MSLTQGAAGAQLGLRRADGRPSSRPLPASIKEEISGILTAWGMR